jgi:protein phosphatase
MARRRVVTCCSLQGQRSENEDLVLAGTVGSWSVCMVLDGMGGRGLGAQASRTVGATIDKVLQERLPPLSQPEIVSECLRSAITEAHQALFAANSNRSNRPVGTCTAALAVVSDREGMAVIAHVGQPFAFRTRGLTATQLFRNSPAEALEEGRRRGLWVDPIFPTLGVASQLPVIDWLSVAVEAGDNLILCSDGIGVLSPEAIAAALVMEGASAPPAERLCRLALARGSRDNVTAAVVQVLHGRPGG